MALLISSGEMRWFSGLVRQMYASRTHAELNEVVLTALLRQLRLIIASSDSFSPDFTQFWRDGARSDTPERYLPEHEMTAAMGDCPTLLRALSGDRSPLMFIWDSGPQVERTEFYNLMMRPFDAREQIVIVDRSGPCITGINLGRDRLFTGAERELCALLQPHLVAALNRVEAHRAPLPAPLGGQWAELAATGEPRRLSAGQAAALRAYFPGWCASERTWPAAVRDWLRAEMRALAGGAVARPPRSLWTASARGQLGLRYFPAPPPAAGSVRLMEIPARPNYYALARRRGLSQRESEVVHWLAEGKRDTEIGCILQLSATTVSWHVQNALRKLGLDSRAAVLLALSA